MRRTTRTRRVATVLVVGGLVAAGCGGDDDDTAPTDSEASTGVTGQTGAVPASEAPGDTATEATTGTSTPAGDVCTGDRVGGEVTMGLTSGTSSLDPVSIVGTGSGGANEAIALYDTLLRYDPANDEFVPMLAESVAPNDDFTEWTLTLRDGITFGNGDPLTAETVQASFARHQSTDHRSVNFTPSQAVTEMEVIDDLTLVFHLDGPWSRFPTLLANAAGMITNPAVVEQQGDGFATDPTGGGAGPYEVERFVPGEELVLRAKDDWWGGPVCIEQLTFVAVPGAPATYEAFTNGELQVAFLRDPQTTAEAREAGVEGFSTVNHAGSFFTLNHTTGPTADPLVRQALAAAIDPDVINERAYGGQGIATTALLDESSVHYFDGLEGPQPDPERAAELVAEAKAGGWDGNLELLCSNTGSEEVCLAVKAMADAAGMNLTVTLVPTSEMIARVYTDVNFQMSLSGLPISDAEPWQVPANALTAGSPLNPGGYSNAEADAALAAMKAAPDEATRQQALGDLQAVWNETIPGLIYASSEDFIAVEGSVKGILPSQSSQIYFDEAYIDG